MKEFQKDCLGIFFFTNLSKFGPIVMRDVYDQCQRQCTFIFLFKYAYVTLFILKCLFRKLRKKFALDMNVCAGLTSMKRRGIKFAWP